MIATVAIKKLTSFASGSTEKLKVIGDVLWKALTFSPADEIVLPRKNLSVSLEKGGLSVAYGIKIFSRITCKGVKEYSFTEGKYPQPEEVASSLVLARNEFGTGRTEVTLSIPKSWTVIKTAEFPSTVKESLPNVVSYEMDRLTPFVPEEAFFDFKVIGESGERLTLLVIAARADMITPYLTALAENGFDVTRITTDLAGMCTLCRYTEKKADAIFIEIGEGGYEGAVSLNGSMIHAFSHTFTADDENSRVEKISSEIMPLADMVKTRGGSPQVFASLKDKNPSLRELLKLRISLPFKVISETATGVKLATLSKNIPFAAVGSLMQSLWPKANSFNLLQKGLKETQKTPFVLTVMFIVAILGIAALYVIQPLRVEEKRLHEIERQTASKKEEVRKIEALKKDIEAVEDEVSTIRQFKENRPPALNLLRELTILVPKSTWLSRARITETTVEIEGHSTSATELLPKLEASKLFKKAEFASPTFRDPKTQAERFNIKMEIEGVRKLEDLLKKETKKPEEEGMKKGAGKPAEGVKNGKK